MDKTSERVEKVPKTLLSCDVQKKRKEKMVIGRVGYLQLML